MKRILLSLYAFSLCLTLTANDVTFDRDEWIQMGAERCAAGNYMEAIPFFQTVLHMDGKTFGYQSEEYALSLNEIGVVYFNAGDLESAEFFLLKSLKLYKKIFGGNSPEYATSLDNIGSVYSSIGLFSKAKPYLFKALELRKNILGEEHPDYVSSLNSVGLWYQGMGDYKTAKSYLLEALELYEIIYDENQPEYITAINNLGFLYSEMGEYDKAEPYLLRALELHKNIYGENHPDYATSLNNLGDLYLREGDLAKAEPYLLQALELRKNILGEEHPNYVITLNDLGILYTLIGSDAQAESYYLRALELCEIIFDKTHPEYVNVLNSVGTFYSTLGDFTKAEPYLLEALELRKKIYGEKHPYYAYTLDNLGLLYAAKGDFKKAESYHLQGLKVFKRVFGENSADYATSLNSLGLLYYDAGDYKSAEPYYWQAMKIRRKILGMHNPYYAASLHNVGCAYYGLREYAKAEPYLIQSRDICKEFYLQSLDFMSESQRNQFWKTQRSWYEEAFPIFSYHDFLYTSNRSIASFAYDNELFHKGLLLNSSNVITRSILDSGDTTLVQQWNDLTTKKQQIIVLEQNDPQSEYVAQLRDEAEVLEKAITKSSAAYRENIRQWEITWDSVRNVLKPNQVAIEYMSAPLNEDSTMYCALLVRDTCTYPILIPLFNEPDVAGLLHTSTGDTAKINVTYQYHHNGRKLAHYIWDPVETYIHPGEEVFFSPTGVLHQIAIENLPYDSTQIYGDVYHIVRLSSTRELVLNKPAAPHEKAALYGGIFYEPLDSVKLRRISEKYRPAKRSTPSFANDTTKRSMAEYLPFTKEEIDSIHLLLANREVKVTVYRKNEACEESLKALSGQKQSILHLATHGFFWTDSAWSPDPMNRCGLLFAWANTALSGYNERLPKGADDGILTAKEISVLDFRGADIVVMSACETGLGDISGEGVFGLQRAFKMAGVQTVLMALWQVNDKATQKLMTAFYRYMSDGYSKREAFRMAQQEIRNYTETEQREKVIHKPSAVSHPSSAREKFKNKGKNITPQDETAETVIETIVTHPYQSPYYWAGFILLD